MQVIKSKDNPLVKQFVSLIENRKEREKQGLFVIEGLRFCKDAVLRKAFVKTVLLSEDFVSENGEYVDLFMQNSSDVRMISKAVSDKIGSTVNSQGVFCLCQMPSFAEKIEGNKIIVLENLQDPGNMGTIIRTAEAFGVNGIILVGGCVDIFSPKVLRSTMGTIFNVPIFRFSDIEKAKEFLEKYKFNLYGAILDKNSKKLSKLNFNGNTAIMIGNEANGISEKAKNACDDFVFIEMSGNAESLNAAIAASVFMWELQKNDLG